MNGREIRIMDVETLLRDQKRESVLLVCGESFRRQKLYGEICERVRMAGAKLTEFSEFAPNPRYESVVKGVRVFVERQCDFMIAAGGGSAIDVAKCIKLFWNMDENRNYLEQEITENAVPILAIPTTAGTGSEATRFAIIYYQGNKQSVSHASCIPEYVLLDASLLETLPDYQRKATMLDAFCHALESFWAVKSTEESRKYAAEAIRDLLKYQQAYLENTESGNEGMLRAANKAGYAINITQTTAGHAMCYKLTTRYGLAHGHAAALCVDVLWPYMNGHTEDCIDPRGRDYLTGMFRELAQVMGCATPKEAIQMYHDLLERLALPLPVRKSEEDMEILKKSVNPDRLKNNPVLLTEQILETLYRRILGDSKFR